MARWAFALAALWFAAAPAVAADAVSEKPDKVSVTIYRRGDLANYIGKDALGSGRDSGLAMISETRTIDLPAGPAIIRFRGVADTMAPQTAQIDGLPGDALERNFDYDLLTPGSLVEKSIGETVQVVRTYPKTGRTTTASAVIRSGASGVVLDFGNGRYEALGCSGLPERLVFAHAPVTLSDAGVLSVHTNAARAGRYVVTLSYIASGLNWKANYVARLDPKTKTLALTGYITLANFGAVGLVDAPTDLVAARVGYSGEDQPVDAQTTHLEPRCWPRAQFPARRPVMARLVSAQNLQNTVQEVVVTGSRIAAQKLADYKMYSAPQPTTVAARQVKQIEFIDQPRVKYEAYYYADVNMWGDRFPGEKDVYSDPPSAVVKLRNTTADGLGIPMPEGSLAILTPDEHGEFIFTSDAHVRDTPVADTFELAGGPDARDLSVERKIVARRSGGPGRPHEVDFAITIDNNKRTPVTLEVGHESSEDGMTFPRESARHSVDAGTPVWWFHLAPGEHRVLTYTVRYPG